MHILLKTTEDYTTRGFWSRIVKESPKFYPEPFFMTQKHRYDI